MAERKSDFALLTLDDLFSTQQERETAKLEKIRDNPLDLIDDFPLLFRYCNISNIPPIFFSALLYPECTAFLLNLHTRQKHGTGTDALRKS